MKCPPPIRSTITKPSKNAASNAPGSCSTPAPSFSLIDDRIASEADPTQHPLYALVLFHLDRATAVDGGELYERCKQLVLSAIDTCLDVLLDTMED